MILGAFYFFGYLLWKSCVGVHLPPLLFRRLGSTFFRIIRRVGVGFPRIGTFGVLSVGINRVAIQGTMVSTKEGRNVFLSPFGQTFASGSIVYTIEFFSGGYDGTWQ